MSDKQYKLIKENWDNYIKEDQENLEEVQLVGMNLILSNLEHLADFFDFLAVALKNEDLKKVAATCRSVDTGLKKLKKGEH